MTKTEQKLSKLAESYSSRGHKVAIGYLADEKICKDGKLRTISTPYLRVTDKQIKTSYLVNVNGTVKTLPT